MNLIPAEYVQFDWDVPIEMDDNAIVYADVLCPAAPGKYPVILTHGVYGKEHPIERLRHRLFKHANSMSNKTVGDVFSADLADAVVFENVNSKDKWLEVHAGGQFDDEISVDFQRRFFDYLLNTIIIWEETRND